MSQENVELHRSAVEAFNRRGLDAFLLLAGDEVAINPLNLELEGGSDHGHDGIRSFWEADLRVFPDFTAAVDELRDLGEVTVAWVHLRGHGTGSYVPFEQPIWQVARWRDRRCLWWRSFRSEADALNDAMLPE
jgi:SnoaL-like polyketide cyclase